MKLRVRFFAVLRERAGCAEAVVEVPAGTTADDLWSLLVQAYPGIAPLAGSVSFAVNQHYVARGQALVDGDEVALIPPVSGG